MANVKTAPKESNEKKETSKEKMVKVFIPYVEGCPDTLFYSVNGRDFYIDSKQAAMGIDVPEVLAEVINNSNAQKMAARELMKSLSENPVEL